MDGIASRVRGAYARRAVIAPPSSADPAFDLAAAYAVQRELVNDRRASGAHIVGVKVGYANRALWRALKLQTPFLPLEDLRDALSPIRALHTAVSLSGIADMGPMLPMLTEIEDPAHRRDIENAARVLRAQDEAFGDRKAA